ncbi:GAF domain-containing protein, partial [bacterium]|nr:GAF domain-containing protein [bacterium]
MLALERILAASNRLNATHARGELTERVVASVIELGGFRRAQLNLWDETVHAYVTRACAGMRAAEITALTAAPVLPADFATLTDARHRYSNCFLVPAPGTASAARAGSWPPGLRLVAPLAAASGERFGFLVLDDPADGLVPDPDRLRLLEFLVQQSATALESAEIYERLAARNAELSAASRKLDSLAKMKRNFVANVSHELRTPLTSISAYSELLQSNLGALTGESLAEFLKVIHAESRRLGSVINDILEIGNLEQGRPALYAAELDLCQLVRRVAEAWTARAHERGLVLAVDAGETPLWLAADQVLLRQLLDHLLDNAVKFSPAGGRVVVAVGEAGTAARLTVSDSGIGVPDDKLGEIFQSFFQVDDSATRAHNGQGVGLAICHDIVQHHDGRIWAENLEPQGTRFTVLLPRRAPVVLNRDADNVGAGGMEPAELLQRLLNWVAGSLGVRTAALMTADDDGQTLTIRAGVGLPGAVVQGVRPRRGAGFAGRVLETGRTLLISDLGRCEQATGDSDEIRYTTPSLLCVPLLEDDRCLGVLTVNNKIDGTALDDDDRLLLESLAPRVASLLVRHAAWRREGLALQQVRQALRATTAVGQPCRDSVYGICR